MLRTIDLYEKIRPDLIRFDLTDSDFGPYKIRSTGNFFSAGLVTWAVIKIHSTCPQYPDNQIRLFMVEMIYMANIDRTKLKENILQKTKNNSIL